MTNTQVPSKHILPELSQHLSNLLNTSWFVRMHLFIHATNEFRHKYFFSFYSLFLPLFTTSWPQCVFHFKLFTILHSCSCCQPLSQTHTLSLCVSPGWSLAWLCVIVYLHLLSLSEDREHNPTEGQWLTGSLTCSAKITALYCFFLCSYSRSCHAACI